MLNVNSQSRKSATDSRTPKRIVAVGDDAILVEFNGELSEAVNRAVHDSASSIAARLNGGIEIVPAYRSLMVYYDPLSMGYDEIHRAISQCFPLPLKGGNETNLKAAVEIPVFYGGSDGPDLTSVAGALGLSEAEVVRLHTGVEYLVYMVGFLPGFPYMGKLPEELALPRRGEPRVKVPKGAVAIAHTQTGIYPETSPGGWHLIGRTLVDLFDPERREPALLNPGDRVRFLAVGDWL